MLLGVTILSGCALRGPDPKSVSVPVASTYLESESSKRPDGAWKLALTPGPAGRDAWWEIFENPELDRLEKQAQSANPNLAVAAARLREVKSLARVADAARAPQVAAGFGPTRERPGDIAPPSTTWLALGTVSYEVDLFGKIGNSAAAAELDAAAQESAYRAALLSLEADVAQTFFSLRTLDSEIEVLTATAKLREDSLHLNNTRYENGDVSELDVAQAQTELSTTQAQLAALERDRAHLRHALAVLLGVPPEHLTLAAERLHQSPVAIPVGLPAELLERRPDVIEAQQALAAAAKRVGVARAAFFPSLTLTADAGYESSELSNLFKWSARSWVLGPILGTALTVPVFDGGLNKANLAASQSRYDEAVGRYRNQVLVAFKEVEDGLVDCRTSADEARFQAQAFAAASRAQALAESRYRNGSNSYLELIDAQRSALSAELAVVQARGAQVGATITLVRALGGGWTLS